MRGVTASRIAKGVRRADRRSVDRASDCFRKFVARTADTGASHRRGRQTGGPRGGRLFFFKTVLPYCYAKYFVFFFF